MSWWKPAPTFGSKTQLQGHSFTVTTPAAVLVGKIGSLFWLRVEGKGCFQNSVHMKKAISTVLQTGTRSFAVDLERCPTMDSTFLGTLTGVALELKQAGGGSLTVLNANARNQQLLNSLGLNHILEVDTAGEAWKDERRVAAAALAECEQAAHLCKEEQAQHVLQAHQALTRANSGNECRFRDVIEFLEKEVHAPRA
jgi:anti-anti-sigma regulatory factor